MVKAKAKQGLFSRHSDVDGFFSGEWLFGRPETEDSPCHPSEEQIRFYQEQLAQLIEEAKHKNVVIPLERLCAKYGLSPDEKTILVALFFARFSGGSISGANLMKLIANGIGELLSKIEILLPQGRLLKLGLITKEEFRVLVRPFFEAEFQISDGTFWEICGVAGPNEEVGRLLPERRQKSSVLWVKEPEVSFDLLALPEPTRQRIEQALWQFQNGGQVFVEYGIADKLAYGKGTTMLFFGPSGTGKTATAEAIAKALGKKIGIVDYPRVYDCWFGDSEKNIQQAFREARDEDCVLLFDEADACFGARLDERHSADRSHNLMTNILMQEIERFCGLVLLTTNREVVMDKAFERRILLKLRFDIPDVALRQQIWELFLKDCPKLDKDVSFPELARRYPIAGGKIKNAVLKAVLACARADKPVTMADLEAAAQEELGREEKREIGF